MNDPESTPRPAIDYTALDGAHREHARLAEVLLLRNKAVLFDALAAAGIETVIVTFDGYGDSGQIENIDTGAGEEPTPLPLDRIEIAREAEHKFRRKVSWGVTCAGTEELFTTLSVPVMTRLRQPERQVLDTLVKAGVARSRSDALAWCVRLTGENSDAWLERLRSALKHVEEVRDQGPGSA